MATRTSASPTMIPILRILTANVNTNVCIVITKLSSIYSDLDTARGIKHRESSAFLERL